MKSTRYFVVSIQELKHNGVWQISGHTRQGASDIFLLNLLRGL